MPGVQELRFAPVTLDNLGWIYSYTSAWGEGSCQHSPVSMWSLSEKYGDAVCEEDHILYTLRSRLSGDGVRVYLAPLGSSSLDGAWRRILEDAHAHGCRARFVTLTERQAESLQAALPGRFDVEEDRGLAEYMCRTDLVASFVGGAMERKRTEVHAFWRTYGDRAGVSPLRPEDVEDVLAFEERWILQNEETHDTHALRREARMIESQLRHMEALCLAGVVLRIDGEVHGFAYGARLSSRFYDAIVEKGDKSVPHIYRVLRQESARQCAAGCEFFNLEEDLDIPGLRAMKLAYQPEYLLRKFIAAERDGQ